jgi:hypothetical protein
MKTECATIAGVSLHIQDLCDLSKEQARKFMPVLGLHGYFVQETLSSSYNFTIEIPDDWADLYIESVGE